MKVDFSRQPVKKTTFEDLGYGDIFGGSEAVYMKVLDGSPKALNLVTGVTQTMFNSTEVTHKPQAILFVNGKE